MYNNNTPYNHYLVDWNNYHVTKQMYNNNTALQPLSRRLD